VRRITCVTSLRQTGQPISHLPPTELAPKI
jgi:hypothetical protein